jgi:hypothetical protein
VIVKDRLQGDGDIQLVLLAQHSYLVAVLPAPACLSPTTRARAAIGHAKNDAELHPVTGVRCLVGRDGRSRGGG